jgi:hypothetical protein
MEIEKRIDIDASEEIYRYLEQRELKSMEEDYKKGVIGKGITLNEEIVDQLIEGSIHIHEHGGSEPIPRMYDEFDMAVNACRAGVRAIVIKTHYTPSSGRNGLVQRFIDQWAKDQGRQSVTIYGGVCLNYPVGGLNPAAVRASAGFRNGKFVWMPSLDSYHAGRITKGATTGFLQDEKETGIHLLDLKGNLLPELRKVLEVVAEQDLVLTIGHYPAQERRKVFEEAKKTGVKRMLADHPIEYHSKGTIEELKILADMGVYIGMYALTCLVIPPVEGPDYPAKMFHQIPTEYLVVGSDCGSTAGIPQVEGIRWMIRYMLFHNIGVENIEKILKKNPAKLLGLEV